MFDLKLEFRLEEGDWWHFIEVKENVGCRVEEHDEYWQAKCSGNVYTAPYVVFRIPEILFSITPIMKIKFHAQTIVVDKSKDMEKWERARTLFPWKFHEGMAVVPLDPEYMYYRIWFGWNGAKLYKNVTIECTHIVVPSVVIGLVAGSVIGGALSLY